MNIFSWENLIIGLGGALVGVFIGLGALQLGVVEGSAGATLLVGSLGLLGLAGAVSFVLKRMLARREYEMQILREGNKSRDRFISMLLHYLRTPLAEMRWGLQTLMEGMREEDQKQLAQKIYAEEMRTLEAIEHLLNVSRAGMGKIAYQFETVPLKSIVEEMRSVVEESAPVAKKKGVALETEVGEVSDSVVRIDKNKILTALKTLVENAVSYTPKDGHIQVGVREESSGLLLSVEDTGIGIPKEDQDKIFIQFFRSENARRTNPKGFGVGLYMTKEFVEKHRGNVWFESKEGAGTTFYIRIPIVRSRTEALFGEISE